MPSSEGIIVSFHKPFSFWKPRRLLPEEFGWRDADNLLEESREVMGVLEAEQVGCLTDVVALHEEALAGVDDIGVDVAEDGDARRAAEELTEVVGGIGHLGGAVGDGGQAQLVLTTVVVILFEQGVEALEDVGGVFVLF